MSGQPYVITGPSGVGKSTIIQQIRGRVTNLGYSISHTSRNPRSNEVNGVDYHFVSREIFTKMIDDGAFVEWAQVYHDLYGTSFARLDNPLKKGLDVVMDLDSQGAKNVKEHFQDSILIYILPPSLEVLEKRLRDRALDDEKVIENRLEKAHKELRACIWYDYIVVNEDIHQSVGEVESIIISERCRRENRLPMVKEIFGMEF